MTCSLQGLHERQASQVGYQILQAVWEWIWLCVEPGGHASSGHQPGVSKKLHIVVHRLLDCLTNRGYRLFVDNYYCCLTLAFSLTGLKTEAVGTVHSNHVCMPKDLVTQRMQKGEVDYRWQKDVLVLCWKDKRDLYLLTTAHRPVMVQVCSRSQDKQKAKAVVDYIGNMASVNHSDQMVSYMPMHWKNHQMVEKAGFPPHNPYYDTGSLPVLESEETGESQSSWRILQHLCVAI